MPPRWQTPRDRKLVDWAIGMVVQDGCDGRIDRPVDVSAPAAVIDGRERIELAGIADEQSMVEDGCDEQKLVGPHLVGLINDADVVQASGALGGVGPLRGGRDDDIAVAQIGQRARDAESGLPSQATPRCSDEPPHLEGSVLTQQGAAQVVRLGVGLSDDGRLSLMPRDRDGGGDDERRLPGAGRRVDDDSPMGAAEHVTARFVGHRGARRGRVEGGSDHCHSGTSGCASPESPRCVHGTSAGRIGGLNQARSNGL